MTLDDYQKNAARFSRNLGRHTVDALVYGSLGLCGESGELAEKVKKVWRGHESGAFLGSVVTPEQRERIVGELGDVLWYLCECSSQLGVSMDDVAVANLVKLTDRNARGVLLVGEGDDR